MSDSNRAVSGKEVLKSIELEKNNCRLFIKKQQFKNTKKKELKY